MSSIVSSQFICQYVECGQSLLKKGKFCNLTCCNRQNALRQKEDAQKRKIATQAAYEKDPHLCISCHNAIAWDSFVTSKAKYCSNSCASTHTNLNRPTQSRNKQRITLLKKFNQGAELPSRSFRDIYYRLASFKFDVYDYPELLDIDLLNRHGWYACGGRSSNPINTNGVTRDHILSVRHGLNSQIHPLLLSHPLNCRLMLASANSQKSATSLTSIDVLVESIKEFQQPFKYQGKCLEIIRNGQVYISNVDEFLKDHGVGE